MGKRLACEYLRLCVSASSSVLTRIIEMIQDNREFVGQVRSLRVNQTRLLDNAKKNACVKIEDKVWRVLPALEPQREHVFWQPIPINRQGSLHVSEEARMCFCDASRRRFILHPEHVPLGLVRRWSRRFAPRAEESPKSPTPAIGNGGTANGRRRRRGKRRDGRR